MRHCLEPSCGTLVERGRCAVHARAVTARRDEQPHRHLYKTERWKQLSKERLRLYPWCEGYPTGVHEIPQRAQCTDHIIAAARRPDLFFEWSNLASLCRDCNTKKAIAEEGGFGR